ncbi:hypothetical protein [Rhizobium sp. R693]|uniref:hypothetical protein n=1 Tax=Rhizobium sp. R693 TaxID=1764276 RepID=UPI000B52D8EB|nr:hypothetical protein [Rhizobium sp. R693]OWV88977.1 hypothetical protein ATY79_29095 [Rhizobium sp. R693]
MADTSEDQAVVAGVGLSVILEGIFARCALRLFVRRRRLGPTITIALWAVMALSLGQDGRDRKRTQAHQKSGQGDRESCVHGDRSGAGFSRKQHHNASLMEFGIDDILRDGTLLSLCNELSPVVFA